MCMTTTTRNSLQQSPIGPNLRHQVLLHVTTQAKRLKIAREREEEIRESAGKTLNAVNIMGLHKREMECDTLLEH